MIKLTDILPETNNKVNRLHLITTMLFLALFTFPLLPFKLTNVILMTLALLTVIAFFIKPLAVGKTLLLNLVFLVPFIPYFIEFCFSGFNPTARFEFEKKLFFFTAPLIIPLFIKVTGFRNYKLALLVFALSVTTMTTYTVASLLIKGIPFTAVAYENGACILRDSFESLSGLHPTYYSIFALSSACFLCYATNPGKRAFRIIYIIFAIMLFITVLFLAVRIAIITVTIFLLVWIIKSKLKRLQKFILGFCALALLVIISFSLPSIKNRFSEIVSWASGQTINGNTVSQRVVIMDCSLKVFSENIFCGTGSRYFQQNLNDCYSSEGWPVSKEQSFNPHNQYLSFGINYGIIILLVFIACLFIIFRKIFKTPEGIYFGIVIIMVFLSESILERQMGVYFWGVIALLLYNTIPKSE
jgi:O-antigen ligase